jgi:hypothetical protein
LFSTVMFLIFGHKSPVSVLDPDPDWCSSSNAGSTNSNTKGIFTKEKTGTSEE